MTSLSEGMRWKLQAAVSSLLATGDLQLLTQLGHLQSDDEVSWGHSLELSD